MASKIIVKMPVQPFVQVNKSKNGELVPIARPQEAVSQQNADLKTNDNPRIGQLEQNIRFLQEQHQLMLAGLHNEIECLRNRNRELQFQLIFSKDTVPSTPSSPEDETKHKVYASPKQNINVTPLQIEILEKELGELKIQLQEIESRNVYLSAIVDEQKKKLERYERDREKERERTLQPDPELLRKLDDAEAMLRRLRRENSDLRQQRDNHMPTAQYPSQAPSGGTHHNHSNGRNHSGNNRGGRHRNNGGQGHHYGNRGTAAANWFPPLHSQSYWQQNGGGNTGGGGGGTSGVVGRNGGIMGESSLPSLHQNGGGGGHYQQGGRKNSNNNHHYHNGGGGGGDGSRKYRNGGGQNKSNNGTS